MRREHVQDGYDVRLEWGREGVVTLGTHCAVVVIAGVLSGAFSPEAELAAAQFSAARSRGLHGVLAASSSGRELTNTGFATDVPLAAAHDASETAPSSKPACSPHDQLPGFGWRL